MSIDVLDVEPLQTMVIDHVSMVARSCQEEGMDQLQLDAYTIELKKVISDAWRRWLADHHRSSSIEIIHNESV